MLHWQQIFFSALGSVVGDVGEVCGGVVYITGRDTGGGEVDDCHDSSEVSMEMSPSPSSCGISAMTVESLSTRLAAGAAVYALRAEPVGTGSLPYPRHCPLLLMPPSWMPRAFGAQLQQLFSYQ
jgi:hypothetical protein